MILALLALVSGEALISSIIWLIILGVAFGLLFWLVGYAALPAPFDRVIRVILAIAAVLVLINVLLGIAGHPVFRW